MKIVRKIVIINLIIIMMIKRIVITVLLLLIIIIKVTSNTNYWRVKVSIYKTPFLTLT